MQARELNNSLESGTIDDILGLAIVEATRWRHRAPSLTHVAYVMAKVYPREFAQRFGRAGHDVLEDMLRVGVATGSIRTARRILQTSVSIDEALLALHDVVDLPDVMVDDLEHAAHSRWLVLQIEDRFRAYTRKSNDLVLDELYVLIATLKVVGFVTAHEAMKARLIAVRP